MINLFTPKKLSALLAVIAVVLVMPSCQKTDVVAPVVEQPEALDALAGKNAKKDADVAVEWMNTLRAVVKSEGKNPPQASRIYAYTAIGLWEAVMPGMPGHKSLGGQIAGFDNLPTKYKKDKLDFILTSNEAIYQVASKIFGTLKPENVTLIEALHTKYNNDAIARLKPDAYNESITYAENVAVAVMARANNDNFATTRTMTYVVPTGNAAYWAPTGPVTSPLEPYWGTLKCFAMPNGAGCTIKSAIPFSTTVGSAFYNQALEVANTVNNLNQGQKDIALWWADGGGTPTPPGHWVGIECQMVDQLNLNLGETALMFAQTNIAMAEAFISCWNEKYVYNLLRPQTYIRNYIAGQGSWTPLIGTPPFPEYPSGHSVSSGAAADILTKMLGKNVAFTDSTNKSTTLAPRSFTSFTAAANEAAISRLYGGIHYREAIENGVQQGVEVSKVIQKQLKFK